MTTVKTAVSGRVEAKSRAPALASIMVHVDWNAGSDARIRLAANLADKFGAVLVGVAGWVPGRERTALSHVEIEQPEKRLKWIGAELDRPGRTLPRGRRHNGAAGGMARQLQLPARSDRAGSSCGGPR